MSKASLVRAAVSGSRSLPPVANAVSRRLPTLSTVGRIVEHARSARMRYQKALHQLALTTVISSLLVIAGCGGAKGNSNPNLTAQNSSPSGSSGGSSKTNPTPTPTPAPTATPTPDPTPGVVSSGNTGDNGGGRGGKGGKGGGGGENAGGERKLASLKTITIPGPAQAEIDDLIANQAATIALGKA